jgi:hypothetical protein
MQWTKAKRLSASRFKRRFGVHRITFDKMVEAVKKYHKENPKATNRGRPSSLRTEDGLLLMLGYYREYRTLFHLAADYDVSEATACRTVRSNEQILIRSKAFRLPGKKKLYNSNVSFEVVVIDATESPVERPKKSNDSIIQGRRNDIH